MTCGRGNHIARLNPDGTLDTAFDPNANSSVNAIALQADGKILVGGDFNGANSIGGQTRNRIARLDATTGLADSFDPNANFLVISITVQADGRVLAGGDFTTIGGQTRNHIARLNTDGTLDMAFNPNANNAVNAFAVQADGKILVGGFFSGANSIGGQTRNFIARLDATTGLADSFDPNANFLSSLNRSAGGRQDLSGRRLHRHGGTGAEPNRTTEHRRHAGHGFQSKRKQCYQCNHGPGRWQNPRGWLFQWSEQHWRTDAELRIARLDPATGLADSFNPNASSTVNAIAVQADGKVLAGGGFTMLAPNGGNGGNAEPHRPLGNRRQADQTLDLGLIGGYVAATAVQRDGKVLIGGSFSQRFGHGAQ